MITETHIRNLQNPTKFVKIAKNSRNSTITHKSRLLKYKINKSILNQNKCQLTRNKQPPKHTAARRTPESVPSATRGFKWTIVSYHELSSDPLLRKRVRRRRCSADRRLRRSIQTNPVLLLRQQTRPPRSPAKRALSAHGTKTHRSLRNRAKTSPEKTVPAIARAFFNGASEDPKFHMLMMALFYSGRKSEGFRTVYPMIDRFYHLCVDSSQRQRRTRQHERPSGTIRRRLLRNPDALPDDDSRRSIRSFQPRRPGRRSLPSGTPVHVWNLLITQKQGGQTKWHHGMKRQNFITSIRSD